MVKLINYIKKLVGFCKKDSDLTRFIKTAIALFILSLINGCIGNYWTLFLLVNGFFAFNYLYATKKDMIDNYYAKAQEALNKSLEKIPRFQN